MSRSYRKTPIFGNVLCRSEKKDKRIANRAYRRLVRHCLKTGKELPLKREVSNAWDFGKDGKRWWSNYTVESMRK